MDSTGTKRPCKYGRDCFRKNPSHLQKYSHPEEPSGSDDDYTPNIDLSSLTLRTPCRYGKKCYNKDPSHLTEYFHLDELNSSDDDYSSNDEKSSLKLRKACRYGEKCYNKDPSHLKEYSHPQELRDSRGESKVCRYGEKCYNKDPLHLKEYSHPQELRDSRGESKVCRYGEKCYNKDPLHLKEYSHPYNGAQSEMKRHTPIYWGNNAFTGSYREINVSANSIEFNIVSDLLNGTIGQHGNIFGTINGRDPAEFIVTKLTRIHNKTLWEEYSFRKKQIIKKNNHNTAACESSKYLQGCPLLMPLLDTNSNEYWLFHGSDPKTMKTLLKIGYDPRVSSVDGMFGGGFYLAENSSKSNQYIPCPSCEQNCINRKSPCQCKNQEELQFTIMIYRTVLGDTHIAKIYKSEIYKGTDDKHPVRRPPKKPNSEDIYDSVMGECKKYGGDVLNYREFIVYDSSQAYPEYVVQFKRSAQRTKSSSDFKSVQDRCYTFLKTNSS